MKKNTLATAERTEAARRSPESCTECEPHGFAAKLPRGISLDVVMAFQFEPLVHRMMDKHGWNEDDARQCFEDTKRYLYLCVAIGKPLAPSKKIDELWHNFILFTMDYEEFCLTRLGHFVHHRPRRRCEAPVAMLDTVSVARQAFGEISENWVDPVQANDDCGTCMSCKSCNGDGG